MPSYVRRLNNLAYINNKKRLKLQRSQTDDNTEEETGEELCKRCGQTGHKDARSRLCQRNKKYDPNKSVTAPTRKREREDDTEEGPPKKRQEVPGSSTSQQGSVSSAAASTSTSLPASADTRSTTATIRTGVRNISTLAQRIADRKARALGKEARRKATRNPDAIKPCADCIKKGCYNTEEPHSSRRSTLCPGHIQNTDEFIEDNVGKGYRRFIRKHGLQELVILEQREKEIFLRQITELVNNYRQIAIKTIGRNITNPNPNLPRADINTVFEQYDAQFFNNLVVMDPGSSVHANALASLANISAQNLINRVSENYTQTLRNYIKIRLKEVFNLNAGDINALCNFAFNSSVNSSTRVAWPTTVPNTPDNIALVDTIINATRITNEPVTLTSITKNPGIYLQRMHQFLLYFEAFNNDTIRTFNEVQTEASYVWVKQALNGSDLFKVLNRKKRNRLSFLAFTSLRDNTNFENTLQLETAQYEYIVNLIQTTRNQIVNSKIYMDESNENRLNVRIQYCFRPEMLLSIKQYKLFSLVPMYSFTRKYVEIDIAHLKFLLRKVQRETQIPLEILRETQILLETLQENQEDRKHDDATLLFSQVFDFDRLRLDLNYNGKEMFTNMVRTDGYGIDFILAGPKKQESDLPDLALDDFTAEELNERFCLWGVDPGQINIFTASDGHGTDPHQVRRYSAAEYYTRAGFKRTNKVILNLKNNDEQFLQAERAITTFKTANMETFIVYIHSVLNNIDVLSIFYGDRFTSLRFLNYIGRQRADSEMTNIFVTGGKKYLKREFKQTGRDEKKKPPKIRIERTSTRKEKGKGKVKQKKRRLKQFEQDNSRIPLVALGDAVFPTSMKGTLPGLLRRLVKALKTAEYQGLLVTVPVTEYKTSRICSNCSRDNTENVRVDGVSLFGVLHCLNQSCNTLWQRDINASRNMHRISSNIIANGEVPALFRR
ncbi:hypothetical protein MFLAVUS_006482 [Mucor flavus]|uniref:Cas12f1-like TNB domain-containing protein n=1 Tax=Mucor flavus TaxID=439312 RepID=A0ABP9Z1N6_9FUNG